MTEVTWGMRFNEHPNYQRVPKGQKPVGCPEWLESHKVHIWQEKGLIIWNDADRKIEAINGSDALRLLDELIASDTWKPNGVSITRLVYRFEIGLPSRKKHKKSEAAPDVEKPKSEPVYEEIMHLPPEAGYELINLLESKKQSITQMADLEKKRFQEAMRQFWDSMFEFSRKKEMSEFDFKTRSFEWQIDDASRMICHYQTAEGRVWLAKNKYFWNTCVKREGHVGNSHYFLKLAEAVDWVEKAIVELANEPSAEKQARIRSHEEIEADHVRLKEKLINSPYWIDPARMEPKRITYKILIDLDAKPTSYKSFETVCGDTYEYADRYPTPTKLASDINLGASHFQVDQPIGDHSGWCRFTSLTTYYQETSATEQAQSIWNQSRILEQFKAGKIIRGRFGHQEVETGFLTLLGACEQADHAWGEEKSRNEFMEWKALQESLCYALDVNDYRDFLGLSAELISNEKLLEYMHETRSDSKLIPDEARRESRIWLAEHKPLE
ncbi:MAG: hypothetical protein M5U11_00845 [Anaerolineales bacterium]|nr:hypothetical protein [Anaerolineales bacterium]